MFPGNTRAQAGLWSGQEAGAEVKVSSNWLLPKQWGKLTRFFPCVSFYSSRVVFLIGHDESTWDPSGSMSQLVSEICFRVAGDWLSQHVCRHRWRECVALLEACVNRGRQAGWFETTSRFKYSEMINVWSICNKQDSFHQHKMECCAETAKLCLYDIMLINFLHFCSGYPSISWQIPTDTEHGCVAWKPWLMGSNQGSRDKKK